MRVSGLDSSQSHYFIDLKEDDWLDKQRIAGSIVARTLVLLKNLAIDSTSKYTLYELNSIAESFIKDNDAIPTFKGYKGFPSGVCMSINEDVVHGIPTETYLQEGDVVSFDLGATVDGAIADSAMTFIVGEPKYERHKLLVESTEQCLYDGINSMSVGKRLGVIGEAVYKCARKNKFSSITQYGGHSLTWNNPHSDPFVPNYSTSYEGIRMQRGLTIAIEPMLVDNRSNKTEVLEDGWTVRAKGVSAHCEHTLFLHDDHVEIITDRSKYE